MREHLCIIGLYGAIYIYLKIFGYIPYLLVS